MKCAPIVMLVLVDWAALAFIVSPSTAFASAPAKFYDATLNGSINDCGVSGTMGGTFGSARWKLGSPSSSSTASLSLRGLSPKTTYEVIFDDAACAEHQLGMLTTDARGNASGPFSFDASSGKGAFLLFPSAGDEFQTQQITF